MTSFIAAFLLIYCLIRQLNSVDTYITKVL